MPDESPTDRALGVVLRARREQLGLSQQHVARVVGVRQATVSRIEAAEASPNWTTVRRFTRALEMSLVDLAAAVEEAERTDSRRT